MPDTAFTIRARKINTRIIAMYHDQGLAPLKALHFDDGINVSLNLPIIRTSVDHGTAFDIAYKKKKPSNEDGETLKKVMVFAKANVDLVEETYDDPNEWSKNS